MEGETKTARIDQKLTFFNFFAFFSKNSGYKEFLKGDRINFFWVKC